MSERFDRQAVLLPVDRQKTSPRADMLRNAFPHIWSIRAARTFYQAEVFPDQTFGKIFIRRRCRRGIRKSRALGSVYCGGAYVRPFAEVMSA